MALTGALLALVLAADANGERLLLCRPKITGDPALARADAITSAAARTLGSRVLDYGVPCEDAAEGGRAARRAGLRHAIAASAEGRTEGSVYVLALADASAEVELTRRTLEVAPGVDPGPALRGAFQDVLGAMPRAPGSGRRIGPWATVGAGAAALAAGVMLGMSASSAADRADGARDPATYTAARKDWERKRTWSGAALAAGGAAVAGGLVWRFAF